MCNLKRTKLCQTCFFFEDFKAPKTELSFTAGHCKILELIKNKCTIYTSGIDTCKAVKDLHTTEEELKDIEKKTFKKFYNHKSKLLEKLYDTEDDEEFTDIEFELEEIAQDTKKYLWTVKGWKI